MREVLVATDEPDGILIGTGTLVELDEPTSLLERDVCEPDPLL